MEKLILVLEKESFNLSDQAIAKLDGDYSCLTINGVEDKDGFRTVSAARKVIKNYRVSIEKRRKELTADALHFQRAINAEAKRITELLEPIEVKLLAQETWFEEEQARIKKEEEEKKRAKTVARSKSLEECGYRFDFAQISFIRDYDNSRIAMQVVEFSQDTEFDSLLLDAKKTHEIYIKQKLEEEKRIEQEKQRIAAEQKAESDRIEAERKAESERIAVEQKIESDRLEKEKAELAAERERLKKIEEDQALEAKRIQDEQDKLSIKEAFYVPPEALDHEKVSSRMLINDTGMNDETSRKQFNDSLPELLSTRLQEPTTKITATLNDGKSFEIEPSTLESLIFESGELLTPYGILLNFVLSLSNIAETYYDIDNNVAIFEIESDAKKILELIGYTNVGELNEFQ